MSIDISERCLSAQGQTVFRSEVIHWNEERDTDTKTKGRKNEQRERESKK